MRKYYYKEQKHFWMSKEGLRGLGSERDGVRELEAEKCGEETTEFSSRRKNSSFLPVATDMFCAMFGKRGTSQAADRMCSSPAVLL